MEESTSALNEGYSSFRLLRLRLIRPPPEWIDIPPAAATRGPVRVNMEIALALQDDYGVTADSFDSLDLELRVLDGGSFKEVEGVAVAVNGQRDPDASAFTITTSSGPVHQLKIALTFPQKPAPVPTSIRLQICMRETILEEGSLSGTTKEMLSLIGEPKQSPTKSWTDQQLVFLRVLSGEVAVQTKPSWNDAPPSKVQTALRRIHLRSGGDNQILDSYSIIERPSLNNSTGQRLWDCAIGLALFLSLSPLSLLPSSPSTETDSSTSPSSQNNASNRSKRLQVVELGAGCGLVSLAASSILRTSSTARDFTCEVVATDVGVTVNSTLRENLAANKRMPPSKVPIRSAVLDWGAMSDSQVLALQKTTNPKERPHLVLLAADVLYNPSSHTLLLDTILSFFRRQSEEDGSSTRAFVAYKARTAGDGDFFDLAKNTGVVVEKVWGWGDIGVYRLDPGRTT